MPEIIFVEPSGTERRIAVEIGQSIMKAAVNNGIDGIEAVCGGVCACATCHVYVRNDWIDALPPPDELEEGMLEETSAERRPNSRLSCQIKLGEELDGLVITIPVSE